MTRTDAHLVHVPKTGGTSIATAFGLEDSHHPASVRRAKDPEAWGRAFTFAIVRNPWDHAVSLWFHSGKWKEIELVPWVRAGCPWTPIRNLDASDQWAYISDPETRAPLVETAFDFAALNFAFSMLGLVLGPPTDALPHLHKNTYPIPGGRKHYSEHFDGDKVAIRSVGARNAELIDAMGYTYRRDAAEVSYTGFLSPSTPPADRAIGE